MPSRSCAFLHALTVALDKCEKLSLCAVKSSCGRSAKATGWALGEAWLPSPDGHFASSSGQTWHIASERLRSFADGKRDRTASGRAAGFPDASVSSVESRPG